MKKIIIIVSVFLQLQAAAQYQLHLIAADQTGYDTLYRKIGTDSIFKLEAGQYQFRSKENTKWFLSSNQGGVPTAGAAGTFLKKSAAGDYSTAWSYAPLIISVQALTSSPADAATIYFGKLPKAPVTAANTSKIYIRQSGSITAAELYCYSGTAGTAEAWSAYIRLNNTTDYLIATVAAATNERVFTNTSLNISVTAGDYFEIKMINPTWATNPLTTIFGGYVKLN